MIIFWGIIAIISTVIALVSFVKDNYTLGIISSILAIISTFGSFYISYLDSIKITSASAVVKLIFKTPTYVVKNFDNGARESFGGAIKTMAFFKHDELVFDIPNGWCKNNSVGSNLFESTETFHQTIFPKVIQIKDIKNSDSILFKVWIVPFNGQIEIESGTIEVLLNNTKILFKVPPQTTVEDPKDKNSSFVSVPIQK